MKVIETSLLSAFIWIRMGVIKSEVTMNILYITITLLLITPDKNITFFFFHLLSIDRIYSHDPIDLQANFT